MKTLWLILLLLILRPTIPGAEPAKSQNGVSDLPVFSLEVKQRIESVRPAPLRIEVTGAGGKAENPLSGSIRFHGASSQGYPKKSFKVALDKPLPWLGMTESRHWVLNAAFVDRSLMRHKLSYDLYRSMSKPGAPRYASASRFVEVNLNGKYQGVYLLMERIDRALLELQPYQTNAPDHACIYKAEDHAAFRHRGHDGFEQREPDPQVQVYWKPLDDLNAFVMSAGDDQFFDPRRGIGTRLDLDNAIDFHLLILLTANMDGFDKNLILARDAQKPGGPPPRFFFVPWDYDATFGQTWHGSDFPPSIWLSNHLFDRLLEQPDYQKKFATRWAQLRQREFALPALYRLIDENVKNLGPAAARNQSKWHGPSVEEDIAEMKRWLARHLKWLDTEIPRRTS